MTVYWGGDNAWYSGTIVTLFKATHKVRIRYDDGEIKLHAMWEEEYRFLPPSREATEPLANLTVCLGASTAPVEEVEERRPANLLPPALPATLALDSVHLAATAAPVAVCTANLPPPPLPATPPALASSPSGPPMDRPPMALGGAASVSVAKEILDAVRHVT